MFKYEYTYIQNLMIMYFNAYEIWKVKYSTNAYYN